MIRRRQGIAHLWLKVVVIESAWRCYKASRNGRKYQFKGYHGRPNHQPIEADEFLAREFAIAEKTQLVKVERVILADNRPVAYLVDILPEDILSGKELDDGFTGSVLDFLIQRGTPQLHQSHTDINAVAAPVDIARALEIQRGDVLLMFQANLFDDSRRVVNFSKSYFIPGHFRFHVVRKVGQPAQAMGIE